MWRSTASVRDGSKCRPAETVHRKGQPLLIKLKGKVEVFYR